MKRLALIALALTATSPVLAKKPVAERPLGVEASIAFADSVGINDFRADGTDAIWIQDQHSRWYHATLFSPCFDLPFAQAVGFETRGTSSLDRFGAVVVGHDRCPIQSLVSSAAPPPKKRR